MQGYRDRIYRSDWARPEVVRNAAVARVERWLATECGESDAAHLFTGSFRALLARWA